MGSYTAPTSFHYVDPYAERTGGLGSGFKDTGSKGSTNGSSCLRHVTQRRHFDDPRTEALYARYMRRFDVDNIRCVIILLLLLFACLSTLNVLLDVTPLTSHTVTYVALCVVLLVLLIVIHTPFARRPRLLRVVVAILLVVLVCYVIVSLPITVLHGGPAFLRLELPLRAVWVRGVWEISAVVLIVYTLLPCQLVVAIVTGVLLTSAHVIVCLLFTTAYDWHLCRQVGANSIIFFAVNVVGVYIHELTDKTSRKLFLDMRASIATRLCLEDENDKLERLLTCSLPAYLATEMKDSVRLRQSQGIFHKSYIQRQSSASILIAELCGISGLTTQGICSAEEFVLILNELFAKFDQIAAERHCLRVRFVNDGYFCVSGIPDSRPDHAKCCLDMALDMIDVVTIIREVTDVDLGLRIGLHSGRLHAAIMGFKRWQFDVWSDDVSLAQQITTAGVPQRVHVSRAALDHLHGEYDVEVNSSAKELREKGVDTYFVMANHPRRFQEYLSLRGVGRSNPKTAGQDILKVLTAMQSHSEIPFAYALQDMADNMRHMSHLTNHYVNEPRAGKAGSQQERVQSRLEQMVDSGGLEKYRSDHVNVASLCFRKSSRERQYQRVDDVSFATCVLLCLVLLVLIAGLHALVLPRTHMLVFMFLFAFTWIASLLILFLGARLKCLRCNLLESPVVRVLLMVVTLILMFATSFVNTLICEGGPFTVSTVSAATAASVTTARSSSSSDTLQCSELPQYVYLSVLLPLLAVVTFAKASSLLKLIVMLLMSGAYGVIVQFTYRNNFDAFDAVHGVRIHSHIVAVLCLVTVVTVLFLHCRHIDWLLRLRCVWRDQTMQERDEVSDAQCTARQTLVNIITPPVTACLMDRVNRGQMEMYSRAHPLVGVVFASIPQFVDVYKHLANNGKGEECMRNLNRVIGEFDELLDEERFHCLEKVKTYGNTYVVAVGLSNDDTVMETREGLARDLATLVDFVFAMKDKLQHVNETSYTHYKLRAGMDLGSVTAGVVGSRRPQYDMWGQCVTLASRLEASSLPDHLQVTELIHDILQGQYIFHPRNLSLRAWRDIRTYFLTAKRHSTETSPTRPLSYIVPSSASGGGIFNPRGGEPSSSATAFGVGYPNQRSSFVERTPLVAVAQQSLTTTPPSGHRKVSVEGQGQAAKVTVTPPGSMGQRRRHHHVQGQGASVSNSENQVQGQRSSTLQGAYASVQVPSLAATFLEPIGRVDSPDLPLVHYAKGPAGASNPTTISTPLVYQRQSSAGRTPDEPSLIASLAQSQLGGGGGGLPQPSMQGSPGSRAAGLRYSRGSRSSENSNAADLSSERLLMISESSVLNYHQQQPAAMAASSNQQSKAYASVQLPTYASVITGSTADGTNQDLPSRRTTLMSARDLPGTSNSTATSYKGSDGDCSLSNSDIVRINGLMKDMGMPEHGVANNRRGRYGGQGHRLPGNAPPLGPAGGRNLPSTAAGAASNGLPRNHPSGIPRLSNPPAAGRVNETFETSSPFSSALPPKLQKATTSPSSSSRIPVAAAPATANGLKSSSPARPAAESSVATTGGAKNDGNKSPMMPPAAVYLIEAKDAPRVVLLPRQRSLPNAGQLPSLQDAWLRQQHTLPQCSEKNSPQSPNAADSESKEFRPVSSPPSGHPRATSLLAPRSKSTTMDGRVSLSLATSAIHDGGGESLISPPSESGTSDRHVRDMDTQSSLSSSSEDDLSASDDENKGDNNGHEDKVANELLEKSLELLGRTPALLSQAVNNNGEENEGVTVQEQPNGNSSSSPAAAAAPAAEGCTNGDVKVEVVATETNAVPSAANGVEASASASVMESHGTQTSLPRPRPKHHHHHHALRANKHRVSAAASAAPPPPPPPPILAAAAGAGSGKGATNKPRPQAPPFQVKRRPRVRMPTRRYRSLDYIPSDVDDVASLASSRAESRDDNSERGSGLLAIERAAEAESLGFDSEAFLSISSMIRRQLMPDNISLSSMSTCSEMSKSDPNLNYDSGSNAYDSEYDNYRPGMASDEDYFVPDPISDVDLDMFDDIDVENVTVSDKYSVDMPLSFLQHKRITQV